MFKGSKNVQKGWSYSFKLGSKLCDFWEARDGGGTWTWNIERFQGVWENGLGGIMVHSSGSNSKTLHEESDTNAWRNNGSWDPTAGTWLCFKLLKVLVRWLYVFAGFHLYSRLSLVLGSFVY